jgi:hypothetical protein
MMTQTNCKAENPDYPGLRCHLIHDDNQHYAMGYRWNSKPVRTKRVSKAQALVNFGLADSLKEAREQLADMGE